jgi:hypothetical protein
MRLATCIVGCLCAVLAAGCAPEESPELDENAQQQQQALSAPSVAAVQSVKDGVYGGSPLRQDGYLIAYGQGLDLPEDLYPRGRTQVLFTQDPNDLGGVGFTLIFGRKIVQAVYASDNQINFPAPAGLTPGTYFLEVGRVDCQSNPQGIPDGGSGIGGISCPLVDVAPAITVTLGAPSGPRPQLVALQGYKDGVYSNGAVARDGHIIIYGENLVSARLANTQTRVVLGTGPNLTNLRVFAPSFASPTQLNLPVPPIVLASSAAVYVAQYQCEVPNDTSTCTLVDISAALTIAFTP